MLKLKDISLPKKTESSCHLIDSCLPGKISIFEIRGKYNDICLSTIVLLRADVFENFQTNCLATYNLDDIHHYTAPHAALDNMLNMNLFELEL